MAGNGLQTACTPHPDALSQGASARNACRRALQADAPARDHGRVSAAASEATAGAEPAQRDRRGRTAALKHRPRRTAASAKKPRNVGSGALCFRRALPLLTALPRPGSKQGRRLRWGWRRVEWRSWRGGRDRGKSVCPLVVLLIVHAELLERRLNTYYRPRLCRPCHIVRGCPHCCPTRTGIFHRQTTNQTPYPHIRCFW